MMNSYHDSLGGFCSSESNFSYPIQRQNTRLFPRMTMSISGLRGAGLDDSSTRGMSTTDAIMGLERW
jgi:hypothetical protein